MPKLTWVGKEKVESHHHDVPYRVLKKIYSFASEPASQRASEPASQRASEPASQRASEPASQRAKYTNISVNNRIIHGDNLEALKSLLPEYEGKINCIYIDPPYNTGNEGWVYNDNVNDPKIKKWLGQVVGKEGEDLSRHDKWLCMMYPRLKLLHRLLADDGAIFVSIDDIEQATLKLMLDEIFGQSQFITNVVWHKKYSVANDHKSIAPVHDFILVYSKTSSWVTNLLPRKEINDKQYNKSDSRGIFRSSDYTCNKTADERPNLFYPIINPNSGEEVWPKHSRVWAYSKEEHQRHVSEDLIYWGKDGKSSTPAFRRYKDDLKNDGMLVPSSLWHFDDVNHTDGARKELRSILSDVLETQDFATPKPSALIQRILELSTNKNSIILDSFAGSGTTAHAVMKLNSQDDGNRKFILVEMMDYAETITAERVRRVMNGYGEGNRTVPGTGGDFDFYTVGDRLMLEDGMLNPAVGLPAIRDYVAWNEGIPIGQSAPIVPTATTGNAASPYWLGESYGLGIFFVWNDNQATTLDLNLLSELVKQEGRYIIYADLCALGDEFMRRHGIIYKKIPRDITRL